MAIVNVHHGIASVLDRKSVLIIEDEMLIAVSVEQVAQELGARTTRVLRAHEAMELADRCAHLPDVCVVDYRSTNDEKRRIAQFVRGSPCKLILMTTDSQLEEDDLFSSADAILQKPFGDEEVCLAFQNALKGPSNSKQVPT